MIVSKKISIKNMRIPKGYSLERDGITQSLIQTWMECDRKFCFKLNCWQQKKQIVSTSFGIAGHYVLECIYNFLNVHKFDIKKLKVIINTSILNHFAEHREALSYFMSDQEIEIMQYQLNILITCYVTKYRAELYNLKDSIQEKEFNFKFHNISLRGVIDRLIITKDKIYIIDHKFMGRIDADDKLVQLLSMDFQTKFYIYIVNKLYPNREIKLVYNIIRKPQTKPKKATKKKPAETVLEYFSRISKDINDRPDHHFKRFAIEYTKWELLEFEEQLLDKLIAIQYTLDQGLNSPAMIRETSCKGYYGNCRFLDACDSRYINPENYEQGDYVSPELHKSK